MAGPAEIRCRRGEDLFDLFRFTNELAPNGKECCNRSTHMRSSHARTALLEVVAAGKVCFFDNESALRRGAGNDSLAWGKQVRFVATIASWHFGGKVRDTVHVRHVTVRGPYARGVLCMAWVIDCEFQSCIAVPLFGPERAVAAVTGGYHHNHTRFHEPIHLHAKWAVPAGEPFGFKRISKTEVHAPNMQIATMGIDLLHVGAGRKETFFDPFAKTG